MTHHAQSTETSHNATNTNRKEMRRAAKQGEWRLSTKRNKHRNPYAREESIYTYYDEEFKDTFVYIPKDELRMIDSKLFEKEDSGKRLKKGFNTRGFISIASVDDYSIPNSFVYEYRIFYGKKIDKIRILQRLPYNEESAKLLAETRKEQASNVEPYTDASAYTEGDENRGRRPGDGGVHNNATPVRAPTADDGRMGGVAHPNLQRVSFRGIVSADSSGDSKDRTDRLSVTFSPEAAAQAQREYDAVVAQYKGTDACLKAPNGKPTNLTNLLTYQK